MRVTTAEEMRNLDRETIELLGIPSTVLMENAARSVVSVIYDRIEGKSAVVVCGKGNNGGDGLTVARNLYNLGYDVEVVLTADVEELKGDARVNAEVLSKLPVPIHVVKESSRLVEVYSLLKEADFVVDAIFGTGLSRAVEGFYRDLIEVVNKANKTIVSVDIPSGLPSDSGEVIGPHISADVTVTFGYPKVAHIMPPACYSVGELFISDISIPEDIPFLLNFDRYILTLDEVAFTYPEREVMSHKYTYGHVAVVGGSTGKTGAPCMSAESALRTGAGLSTVVIPASLNQIFEVKLTEVMSIPIPDEGKGFFGIGAVERVVETVENGKFSSVVLGPGLGNELETFEFAKEVMRNVTKPLLIDADGLNAIAGSPEVLKDKEQEVVITPHVGEFARLTGLTTEEILKSPHEKAREFAQKFGVTVVLKSGRTVVATPNGKVYINVMGNPGMATAGTGDVLSGVIGALLGMGIDGEDSAKFGVFLHSLAGDLGAQKLSQESLKACDVIDFIPAAVKLIKEKEVKLTKHRQAFVTSFREILGV